MALHTLATVGLSAAVLAGVGGGIGYASEGAVPGDLLYGFKTNVNEGLLFNLNGSADSRADAEVALAKRRIEEYDRLKAEGSLDAETQTAMEAEIQEHLANARQYVASVEAEGDLEAAAGLRADLRTALRAYDDLGLMPAFDENADASASAAAEADASAGAVLDGGDEAAESADSSVSDEALETDLELETEVDVETDASAALSI